MHTINEGASMTIDEIINLAREADPFGEHGRLYQVAELTPETLARFAALVRNAALAEQPAKREPLKTCAKNRPAGSGEVATVADVELLPLPHWMETYRIPGDDFHTGLDQYLSDRMQSYARANIARAVAPLQAEIERLQAEVDRLKSMTAVTMGVGSGDGNLFVHGDCESIKAAQAIVLERGALRAEVERLRRGPHPAITHCDNCGCDWLDNGLNPIGCPYCKQPQQEHANGTD